MRIKAVVRDIVRARLSFVKKIFDHPLWRVAGTAWAFLACYDLLASQILPDALASRAPKLREVVYMTSGFLSPLVWFLIGCVLCVLALFEYAFRRSRTKDIVLNGNVESQPAPNFPYINTGIVEPCKIESSRNLWPHLFKISGDDFELCLFPDTARPGLDAVVLVLFAADEILDRSAVSDDYVAAKVMLARQDAPNIRSQGGLNAALTTLFQLSVPRIIQQSVESGEVQRVALLQGGRLKLSEHARVRARSLANDLEMRA